MKGSKRVPGELTSVVPEFLAQALFIMYTASRTKGKVVVETAVTICIPRLTEVLLQRVVLLIQ